MRTISSLSPLLILLGACVSWEVPDVDQDGILASEGDCNDADPNVGPGVAEIWYDGIDQNCDGNDADQDGDGFLSVAVGGTDCWDDPSEIPTEFAVIDPTWLQPTAAEVNPDAAEIWYDGIDGNCDAQNDFDQDGDGYLSSKHADADGTVGDDCIDGSELDDPNLGGLDPADVNPGIAEEDDLCYDGTNADCDTREADELNTNGDYLSDYDCDQDGWMQDEECDDTDSAIEPNDAPDPWYDCIDANCDGNDGDMDGDGYVSDDYAAACPNWGELSAHVGSGDCWDDLTGTPSDFTPINSYPTTSADAVNPDPSTTEVYYDGIDQNCDGASDFDADEDGYATTDYPNRDGLTGEDCSDDDANVRPGVTENCSTTYDDNCDGELNELDATGCSIFYVDADQDGQGDENSSSYCFCEALLDESKGYYFTAINNADCDDTDADTYLGADEYCDGHDDDCDGQIDEDSAVDAQTWYADQDSDGYGDSATSDVECTQPSGYVLDNTDCRPTDASAFPGADETCDGHDDDCDNEVDEDDSIDVLTWYADSDKDGYGDPDDSDIDCYQPSGYVADNTDCRPNDISAFPGADEYCDGHDDDCDNEVDEDSALDVLTWYRDSDNDGYGDPADTDIDCYQPSGFVADNTDCRPTDTDAYPGADEYCDGHDDDCDTVIDEDDALDVLTWYADTDEDGFGDPNSDDIDCYQPSGFVADNTDCDDSNASINTDGVEVCDSADADEDCDGDSDDDDSSVTGQTTYYTDGDSDGWGDDSSAGVDYCDPPSGVVTDNTDCDDADTTLGSVTLDGDCDGTLTADDCDDTDATSTIVATDADCDGTLTADDCDDIDATSTIVADDADCDGTLTADDCDDSDATSTVVADDADCDGTLTVDDCDDSDATSTVVADDADCDGTLTADDCDDSDATSTVVADDADCDGTLTADDCDDSDSTSTVVADDGDCDGVLTADDCDDGDATSTVVADDADCDGSITSEDCDDSDSTIYPFAGDTYGDSIDSDCDNLDCEADFSGSTYFTVCAPETTDWDSMDATCIAAGYHGLASIRTAAENTDLQALVSAAGLWGAAFGATDESVEGTWEWFDGATWSYENFGTSHYGGTTSENCVEMDGGNGTWNDCTCTSSGSTTGMACQYRDPCDIDGDGYDSNSSECGGVDCDDNDASSTIETTDADCDGSVTADDCDDNNPNANTNSTDNLLSDLDCDGIFPTGGDLGSAEYKFLGEAAGDYAGWSVANAGDVDGDGIPDILIGARWEDTGGSNAGAAYLVLGASLGTSATVDLSTADYKFVGEDAGDQAGYAVASAGDVDGDGLSDLLIGTLLGGTNGKAYIVLGSSLGTTATIDLSTADYIFEGDPSGSAGRSVASAGDVDGDGLDDVLIGNPSHQGGLGRAALVLGSSLGSTTTVSLVNADYVFTGNAYFGGSVVSPGDVDGDGLSDLLIGQEYGDNAYLFFGASLGTTTSFTENDADYDFSSGTQTSFSLQGSGDFDGDGLADIISGTYLNSGNSGAAFVHLAASLATTTAIDLTTSADYEFQGENSGDMAGYTMGSLGDLDGDGLDDLLVNAVMYSAGTNTYEGAVYIILAASFTSSGPVNLSTADYKLVGETAGDEAGASFASAGDIDGDGLPDLLIGGKGDDTNGTNAGAAYLILSGG